MTIIKHIYSNVKGGIATAASIELEITENDLLSHRIFVEVEKIPFQSQGMIEGGHKVWVLSAKRALEVILKKIDLGKANDITIKKLEGRIFLDTNNASIGVACILGVMKYMKMHLTDSKLEKIDTFVCENWESEIEEIPNFEYLFN